MDFANIGKALRSLRGETVMKQREVAELAGVTPSMLSSYETGKHRPSLETTERVLGAMGKDVLDLTRVLHRIRRQEEAEQVGQEIAGKPAAEVPARLRDELEEADLSEEEREVLLGLIPGLVKLIRYLKG